jgi:hypothetical protein
VDIQLRSPAQANAARYRTLAAFACPGQDQFALELGQTVNRRVSSDPGHELIRGNDRAESV